MSSDIKDVVVQKTQKMLGKYVKKPVLSEKLLKKPPFRFLHDVICAVIKETGFLEGLFTADELVSGTIVDKEGKVGFLNKLIDAIKFLSKSDLKVKANKIVAGLEPTETNLLLQAIAKALDRKIDSSDYVKNKEALPLVKPGKDKMAAVRKAAKPSEKVKAKKTETPKSSERIKAKPKTKAKKEAEDIKEEGIKEEQQEKIEIQAVEEEVTVPVEEPLKAEKIAEPEEPKSPRARPKSARPKSADLKERLQSAKKAEVEPAAAPTPAVLNSAPRPKSSLRPPSVRPSSARPGAPRLRPESALPVHETVTMGNINVIVENVDMADDEETVVIHNAVELVEEQEVKLDSLENKGHLVEQILEQLGDVEPSRNVQVDKGEIVEVKQLRGLIQSLTKTANPLGKLLNYLQEDVDAMHAELQMWMGVKRQLVGEIDKRKRLSAESDKPLLFHLEQLQLEIGKQEKDIVAVRGNILRNEARIKEILRK